MCDIDLGEHPFTPISNVVEFDGCGHTIRGLNAVGKAYVGLFQAISSNCEIKNLTIENAVVKASNDDARVGILVGDVYDSLTVENCYVSGTIETTDGTNKIEAAGGLRSSPAMQMLKSKEPPTRGLRVVWSVGPVELQPLTTAMQLWIWTLMRDIISADW